MIYSGLLFLLSSPVAPISYSESVKCQSYQKLKWAAQFVCLRFVCLLSWLRFQDPVPDQGLPGFCWRTRSVTTICLQVKQLVVPPGYSAFFKCKEMSTVHGPRSLFPVLCPCAVCPCRCSTQISGLCIVVWLGFGPGVSGFNLSLLLSLYSFDMPLSDVNQIVCWLSLRLVSQLQLPLCQYSFPFPYPFPFPVPA